MVDEGALHGVHADFLKVLERQSEGIGSDFHLLGERRVAHEPVVRTQKDPEVVAEQNRERMLAERGSRTCSDVAGKAHLQGDSLVLNEVSQLTHLLDHESVQAHVVHKPCAMPYPVGAADFDGLPDGIQTECLTGMDGDVEILVADELEGIDVLFGRIAFLVPCQVESHDSAVTVGNRKLRNLKAQVGALVAHRTQKQPELNAGFPSALLQTLQNSPYDTVDPKAREMVATPEAKTIEDLCKLLGIPARKTAKALFMVGAFVNDQTGEEEDKLVVGIVRGDMDIEENKLQNAAKANSLRPAHDEEIVAAGMVPGYGSPIGCKAGTIVIVDDSVAKSNNLVAGANKEGYHFLNTNFGTDYTGTVADIASAAGGYRCPDCGKSLNSSKGVEVGNIFQLGTRYSESMGCYYQDENGQRKPVIMGSYGIGIGRLLACLCEEYNDENGLKLPIAVAPFQVHFISLIKDTDVAEKIYKDLEDAGIEVLYDDRKESAGVKFADADLIGIPIRITLGNRSFQQGKCEVKLRSKEEEVLSFDLDNLAEEIKNLIRTL